jgi:hypothetical protein
VDGKGRALRIHALRDPVSPGHFHGAVSVDADGVIIISPQTGDPTIRIELELNGLAERAVVSNPPELVPSHVLQFRQ